MPSFGQSKLYDIHDVVEDSHFLRGVRIRLVRRSLRAFVPDVEEAVPGIH